MEEVIYKVYCETNNKWCSFKDKNKALNYYNKLTCFGKTAKIILVKKKEINKNYKQIKMEI